VKTMTKTTAWKWFSLYIRLRDSFEGGYVKCCTCSSVKHFKDDMSAGHYFTKGAYKRLEFDERNVHGQCNYACNRQKSGNLGVYTGYMIERYGADIFDRLKLANVTNPRGYDYAKIADEYRGKVKELCKQKGIEL